MAINTTKICYGSWIYGTNTYPVTYTKRVCVAFSGEYNWNQYARVTAVSINNFTVSGNADGGQTGVRHWIAIGI